MPKSLFTVEDARCEVERQFWEAVSEAERSYPNAGAMATALEDISGYAQTSDDEMSPFLIPKGAEVKVLGSDGLTVGVEWEGHWCEVAPHQIETAYNRACREREEAYG